MKSKKVDAAALAGKYISAVARGKLQYRRADAALSALAKVMKPGQMVILRGGKKYQLLDQFAVKTVVFRACGVRRFKLEEIVEP